MKINKIISINQLNKKNFNNKININKICFKANLDSFQKQQDSINKAQEMQTVATANETTELQQRAQTAFRKAVKFKDKMISQQDKISRLRSNYTQYKQEAGDLYNNNGTKDGVQVAEIKALDPSQAFWNIYHPSSEITDHNHNGFTRKSFFAQKGSLLGIEEDTPSESIQYHYYDYIESSHFIQMQNKGASNKTFRGILIDKKYLRDCDDSYYEYTVENRKDIRGELLLQYGNQFAYYTKDPNKEGYDFVRFKEDENGNCTIIEFSQNENEEEYFPERDECPFNLRKSDYICYFDENGNIKKYLKNASVKRISSLNELSAPNQ